MIPSWQSLSFGRDEIETLSIDPMPDDTKEIESFLTKMKSARRNHMKQRISQNKEVLEALKRLIEVLPVEERNGNAVGKNVNHVPQGPRPVIRNFATAKFLNDNMYTAMRNLNKSIFDTFRQTFGYTLASVRSSLRPTSECEELLHVQAMHHQKRENSHQNTPLRKNSAKVTKSPDNHEVHKLHSAAKSAEGTRTIKVPNWNISLTSNDCMIQRKKRGWQISPKCESRVKEELKSATGTFVRDIKTEESTTLTPVETVNVETSCKCDDLAEDDDYGDEQEDCRDSIMKKYVKLLTKENARINFILKLLTTAVKEHKIFVIVGTFPVLRKSLVKRGWLEKGTVRRMLSMPPNVNNISHLGTIGKLLKNPPDLLWYTNKKSAVIKTAEETIVNKFVGCYFTSKIDMCNNLESSHWFCEEGVSNILFPRCYSVTQLEQVEEFIEDFYITACIGFLKWILFLTGIGGPSTICSGNGTVPISGILFAVERCTEYISIRTHEDIDRNVCRTVPRSSWSDFLNWHRKIVYCREQFQYTNNTDINDLLKYAAVTLKKTTEYRPQNSIDGMRNVWILKPGDKSLGKGIQLRSTLSEILHKIKRAAKENTQYVVQKYIERPLLVYKTKIDVRQWFLITNTHPLIIWMYKDVLIRFASRDFTLDNFHESIHLCNTSVQLQYRKLKTNEQIPSELHWNLQKFQEYLKETNREFAWDKVIKPGIKENLIGALLASQENMVNRKNSFQLYGADFVIMDDLSVWLIEINTNPRFHPPSSAITEELYPEVIEDTMKDRGKNKKISQGKFECIYKQRNPFCGNARFGQGVNLAIRGKALPSTSRK